MIHGLGWSRTFFPYIILLVSHGSRPSSNYHGTCMPKSATYHFSPSLKQTTSNNGGSVGEAKSFVKNTEKVCMIGQVCAANKRGQWNYVEYAKQCWVWADRTKRSTVRKRNRRDRSTGHGLHIQWETTILRVTLVGLFL